MHVHQCWTSLIFNTFITQFFCLTSTTAEFRSSLHVSECNSVQTAEAGSDVGVRTFAPGQSPSPQTEAPRTSAPWQTLSLPLAKCGACAHYFFVSYYGGVCPEALVLGALSGGGAISVIQLCVDCWISQTVVSDVGTDKATRHRQLVAATSCAIVPVPYIHNYCRALYCFFKEVVNVIIQGMT